MWLWQLAILLSHIPWTVVLRSFQGFRESDFVALWRVTVCGGHADEWWALREVHLLLEIMRPNTIVGTKSSCESYTALNFNRRLFQWSNSAVFIDLKFEEGARFICIICVCYGIAKRSDHYFCSAHTVNLVSVGRVGIMQPYQETDSCWYHTCVLQITQTVLTLTFSQHCCWEWRLRRAKTLSPGPRGAAKMPNGMSHHTDNPVSLLAFCHRCSVSWGQFAVASHKHLGQFSAALGEERLNERM